MPSRARLNFERHLLRDVELLMEQHRQIYQGPGRPLSVLTRSGVFLLCAAWELYCEDVLMECFELVVRETGEPMALPEGVRRTLAHAVKSEKNELAALRLAGDGWRAFLREKVRTKVEQLNTPNAANITDLFARSVGVDVHPFLDQHEAALTAFISKRGDIAHRGAQAGHVSINDLAADYAYICALVRDLDNHLIDPIQGLTGRRPWNRRQ
jgi:hypothetical protein